MPRWGIMRAFLLDRSSPFHRVFEVTLLSCVMRYNRGIGSGIVTQSVPEIERWETNGLHGTAGIK
jgi:hypothetical protein